MIVSWQPTIFLGNPRSFSQDSIGSPEVFFWGGGGVRRPGFSYFGHTFKAFFIDAHNKSLPRAFQAREILRSGGTRFNPEHKRPLSALGLTSHLTREPY